MPVWALPYKILSKRMEIEVTSEYSQSLYIFFVETEVPLVHKNLCWVDLH